MRDRDNIIQLMEEVNPDFVGFIYYPASPRYFLQKENKIPSLVPPEKRTGVFVNAPKVEILKQAATSGLKNIQLHGNETPELCRQLMNEGFIVIKVISLQEQNDLSDAEKYFNACDYLLFDTKSKSFGGTGKKFDWKILQHYKSNKPYFLSGGIDAKDIDEINRLHKKPYCIDINSCFETAPGLKEIQKITQLKNLLTYDA